MVEDRLLGGSHGFAVEALDGRAEVAGVGADEGGGGDVDQGGFAGGGGVPPDPGEAPAGVGGGVVGVGGAGRGEIGGAGGAGLPLAVYEDHTGAREAGENVAVGRAEAGHFEPAAGVGDAGEPDAERAHERGDLREDDPLGGIGPDDVVFTKVFVQLPHGRE